MNRGLACLLLALLLLIPYIAISPAVQAQEYEVFIQGKSTALNSDLTAGPPWRWYEGNPVIVAGQQVGMGAVVAGGVVATCRNGRWNHSRNAKPYLHVFLDKVFQWMVPGAKRVLWYEGYGVYNDSTKCSQLISALTDRGYIVVADGTMPITSDLLTGYDVVVIPQLQLGAIGTGGDPTQLPDADVQALKEFVEEGGGLLVLDASDWGGYNFFLVQNKILEALGFGLRFQSDQVSDTTNRWGRDFEPIAEVVGDVKTLYEGETETSDIGLYSICSLAESPEYAVEAYVAPLSRRVEPGQTAEFEVVVKNKGKKRDTFALEASSYAGWEAKPSPSTLTLAPEESGKAKVRITVPSGTAPGDLTYLLVTAVSRSDPEVKATVKAGVEVPHEFKLGRWIPISKTCPYLPDYGITVAGAGDYVYITNTSVFARYHVPTGAWENLPIPGVFMNGASLAWDGGDYLYALPGASYNMVAEVRGGVRRYDFWRFNLKTLRWEVLPSTPWHSGPGNALAFARVEGEGYVFALLGTSSRSGTRTDTYNPGGVQFWRFNPRENRWDKRLADIPYGADDGASLVWVGGDYLYALPGAYDEGLPDAEERHFLRYSISLDVWEELEPLPPQGRGGVDDGGAMVWDENRRLYVLKGGDDWPYGGGSTASGVFWSYDLEAEQWEVLENLPGGVAELNGRRLAWAAGNVFCWRGYPAGKEEGAVLWMYCLNPIKPPVEPTELPLGLLVGAGVLAAALAAVALMFRRRK